MHFLLQYNQGDTTPTNMLTTCALKSVNSTHNVTKVTCLKGFNPYTVRKKQNNKIISHLMNCNA